MKNLKEFPNALKEITQYFLESLIKSTDNDNIPEDFKESLVEKGILISELTELMSTAPSLYFPIFDRKDILIYVVPVKAYNENKFFVVINDEKQEKLYSTRLEAEQQALILGIEQLENKLKPIEDDPTTI